MLKFIVFSCPSSKSKYQSNIVFKWCFGGFKLIKLKANGKQTKQRSVGYTASREVSSQPGDSCPLWKSKELGRECEEVSKTWLCFHWSGSRFSSIWTSTGWGPLPGKSCSVSLLQCIYLDIDLAVMLHLWHDTKLERENKDFTVFLCEQSSHSVINQHCIQILCLLFSNILENFGEPKKKL